MGYVGIMRYVEYVGILGSGRIWWDMVGHGRILWNIMNMGRYGGVWWDMVGYVRHGRIW